MRKGEVQKEVKQMRENRTRKIPRGKEVSQKEGRGRRKRVEKVKGQKGAMEQMMEHKRRTPIQKGRREEKEEEK